jgi:hypothetical protein
MADGPKIDFEPKEQSAAIIKKPGMKVTTKVYRGAWDELKEDVDKQVVGRELVSNSGMSYITHGGTVSQAVCQRVTGGLADLTLTTVERESIVLWNLDFMEVQKPIRAWHADETEITKKPDLAKLSAWETFKEQTATRTYYDSYYWKDPSGVTGSGTEDCELKEATLKLAKMIREEGIETFSVFTPVITKVTYLESVPDDLGANIGKVGAPSGSDETFGSVDIAKLTALAVSWLKNTDRLQCALDGSLVRTEVWIGAKVWNENLYEKA